MVDYTLLGVVAAVALPVGLLLRIVIVVIGAAIGMMAWNRIWNASVNVGSDGTVCNKGPWSRTTWAAADTVAIYVRMPTRFESFTAHVRLSDGSSHRLSGFLVPHRQGLRRGMCRACEGGLAQVHALAAHLGVPITTTERLDH